MSQENILKNVTINSSDRLICILGKKEKNLKIIAKEFNVEINSRGNDIFLKGIESNVNKAEILLKHLEGICDGKELVTVSELHEMLNAVNTGSVELHQKLKSKILYTDKKGKPFKPRTLNQLKFLESIENNEITFGIGPSGSGKTILAVATALRELKAGNYEQILLVRPAVEAGEKLGFLPGDENQKLFPFLMPLYGYLEEFLGDIELQRLTLTGTIQIKSLAFMRGSDFKNSFIIMDEAQNSKPEQMKMFLTRLSSGSKMVVTGDVSQSDLGKNKSGLSVVQEILKDIPGIGFSYLDETDILRHPLVREIVKAFAKVE